jgi:hypothetical protein
MRQFMRLLSVLIALALPCAAAEPVHKTLLPRPRKIQYGSARVPVRGLRVRPPANASAEDRFAARELANFLSDRAMIEVSVSESPSSAGTITLVRTGDIDPLPVPGERPGPDSREAYSLSATKDGVEIKARSSAGLYYGIQTLSQLVEGTGPEAFLPEASIEDWPAMAYRGVMVDMSHGPLLTVDEIKRQLDFLARWKVNQYYFYSEASIELDGYPLLNPDGRFTKAQVRDIVEYARRRHIDVVPCLELYGHLHDLFRVEKYADLAALPHGGEFDPRNPKVIGLLGDWAGQIASLFPSPFVHIGFDETWQIEMAARKEGAQSTPARLFSRQLASVAELFTARGRKVMAWADIIVKYPEIVAGLPPGLIGVAWEYNPQGDFRKWLDPLQAAKVPTIIATGVSNWREIFTDFDYTFGDIDAFLAAAHKANALGMMNTVWSDSSQSLIRAAWPAIAYGGAAAWQTPAVDRSSFFADYCRIVYPEAVASSVAAALDRLARSELVLQKALGQDTMHAFWDDPLDPDLLAALPAHREDLRQCRLLAEEAEEQLGLVRRFDGERVNLASLLVSAQMLDYAGMRYLAALELADRWKELGPKIDKQAWWTAFAAEWEYQSHNRIVDLMDRITAIRKNYKSAWLQEYTDYRLESTLGRWDAEYEYWRQLQARFRAFGRKAKDGMALPPLDSVVHTK